MELKQPIRVLLIEDNPGDARLIQEMLAETKGRRFSVQLADRLSHGLACLSEGTYDVVLLDLSLPDAQGWDAVVSARARAPDLPFVVLTGRKDEQIAIEVVQRGVQDYLIKGEVDGGLLARSIHYAIERNRLQQELREMSLTDSLTGLKNWRGFIILANLILSLAERKQESPLLVKFDMDHLKVINDTYGHHEGDLALMEFSKVLQETFRNVDVKARIGGDEFVVLLVGLHRADPLEIKARLQQQIDARNARTDRIYKLSVSVGMAVYEPAQPRGIEALMDEADNAMYKDKQHKRMKPPG